MPTGALPDLIRFVEAQDSVRHRVVKELTAGQKRSHWMWFVFPQLAGLGHSTMAERYAIRDLDQAKGFLSDPILGDRLRQDVSLMLRHAGKSALQILGAPDDFKFRLCVRTKPTGPCSSKRWISSTKASPILAPNSYLLRRNSFEIP